MNFTQVLKYSGLLLVGLLAGNSFAFVLGMGPAMEKLSANSYIVFHQGMQKSFLGWTPALCVLLMIVLFLTLLDMRHRWREVEFFLIFFALVCIAEELVMTWAATMPLNRMIQSWALQGGPGADWEEVRSQWLHFMYWRCSLLVASFGLLVASVCAKSSESQASRAPDAVAVFSAT